MFRLQSIAVLLSPAAQGLSIGCEYVGLDGFKEDSTGNIITQLDPLVEGEGFDIIDPYKCSFCFHTPRDRTATLANTQDSSEDFRNVLPSGKNNVQSIPPPIYADRTEEENAELVHAKAAGIVGLAGKVGRQGCFEWVWEVSTPAQVLQTVPPYCKTL